MMKFVLDNIKTEWQLTEGTVDWNDKLPFPGNVVRLEDKMSLLSKEFFEDVSNELRDYLDQSLMGSHRQPLLFQ
ncbi:MAG TPA: hypothetical protein PKK34_06710 [Syntrophorhabdaceae bacterium]|nr:hypothetical protein [Syntrophorhabdaceae bacterium]